MKDLDFYRQIGNMIAIAAQSIYMTDHQALLVKDLHKKWVAGEKVEEDNIRSYEGSLYRVKKGMGHVTQASWTPNLYAAAWEVINETNAGTLNDPIPWQPGMRPEAGKYYSEGDLILLCKEDPMTTLHNKLSELYPGRYFDKPLA